MNNHKIMTYRIVGQESFASPAAVLKAINAHAITGGLDGIRSFRQCIFGFMRS